MKDLDCIDSCIILGTIFEEKENEKCKQYLNIVGYKLRNNGLLTVPLIGEIFANLFLKVYRTVPESSERKLLLQKAVDFFDDSIVNLLLQEKLVIAKIENSDHQFIERIKELDYAVTDDDALHLSSAINKGCQKFITLDAILLRDQFKSRIKTEFNIIITRPM